MVSAVIHRQGGRSAAFVLVLLGVMGVFAALWQQSTALASSSPVNLLPNSGFEQPASGAVRPAGWTSFASNGGHGRPVWTTAPVHGGARAVGVRDATGEFGWHTSVSVRGGTVYRLSAFAQAPGPAPARVQIAWFGPAHRYLGSAISSSLSWQAAWTPVAVDGRAPAAAISAELVVGTTGGGAGTSVVFDDASLLTLPATLAWTSGPESVFIAGQPITLTLNVTPQSAISQTLPLTVSVRDLAGSLIVSSTQVVTLTAAPGSPVLITPTTVITGSPVTATVPPPGAALSLAVPVTTTGWYRATAVLGDVITSTVSLSMGVITPTAPLTAAVPLDPSPLGIGAYLTTIGGTSTAVTTTRTLASLGARWDREEFRWQTLEPKPGQFSWQATDTTVIAAHNAGLSVLGLLDYWSTWTQSYTTTGYTDFAAYAAAVVARYRPGGTLAQQQGWGTGFGVRAWEVWNEPTTLAYWTGTPQQFGLLLKAASAAIHRADPAATVMYTSFGAVGDPLVLQVAGHNAIDAIALHFYAGPVAPEQQLLTQGVRAAHLRTGKPVWVTETGYAVFLGGTSLSTQGSFLIRAYAELIASGAQHILWYAWRDAGAAENYGLTTGDRQPKPVLVDFATMAHFLSGTRPTGTLQLGAALRAFTYARGSAQVAVVWSTMDATATMTLAPGSSSLAATDPLGHPAGLISGRSLVIPLTGQPLFLTATRLSHSAFAALIRSSQIVGLAPVAAQVAAPEAPQSSLPRIAVTLTGQTNISTRGWVTLSVPPSWVITPTVQSYGPLAPGATQTITFTPTMLAGLPDPGAVVTAVVAITPSGAAATLPITMTGTVAGPSQTPTTTGVITTEAPVAETVALRGTPQVNGSLTGWNAAPPILLQRADQLIGDPNWSPRTFSAAARLLWDDRYFYISAVVTDTDFYEPNSDFYLYQGDSLQFNVRFSGPASYAFGLALTPRGTQLYRYEGGGTLAPGLVTDAPMRISLRPGSPVMHIVYTIGLPWHDIGLAGPPASGARFLANVTVNDNRLGVRADWLTLTSGRGVGFSPAPSLAWDLRDGPALGALRAPTVLTTTSVGASATAITPTATLTFTAPYTAVVLLITPGRQARGLTISVNGQSVLSPTTPPPGTTPAVPAFPGNAPVLVDISAAVRPGLNVLTMASEAGAQDAVVTVLSGLPAASLP